MSKDELSTGIVQAQPNAALENLKTTNDPVKRRELLVTVRQLTAALE
jgi:hypothetical protein